MDRIGEIAGEIARLTQEREDILNTRQSTDLEYLHSLEWTKDCNARLHITGFHSYGLDRYEIKVVGDNLPRSSRKVTILGDSVHYQENVNYNTVDHGFDGFGAVGVFTTSSSSKLIEFLQNVQFRKLEYETSDLNILLAAKACSERCQS